MVSSARKQYYTSAGSGRLPETYCNYVKSLELRYGDAPDIQAACYGKIKFEIIKRGRALSKGNIEDLDTGLTLVYEFKKILHKELMVALKHTNPCGAVASYKKVNFEYVKNCDPEAIFGATVVASHEIDEKNAERMNEIFLDVIAAPDFTEGALEVFERKKNLRLIKYDIDELQPPKYRLKSLRSIDVLLLQENKIRSKDELHNQIKVLKGQLKADLESIIGGWYILSETASNAAVLYMNKGEFEQAIGIGAGQQKRIDAIELAVNKAKKYGHDVQNAIMLTDGFMPHRDNVERCAQEGIKIICAPIGSIKDPEIFDLCEQYGITLVSIPRCFKH